ncbi:hypothetical protein [Nocardia transvalensis]|uniref:hypothetical protein n=1 Tax=Nocardia transvalensis TaxID=37333 RepID=UPI0018931265|nr:hypothetical protein [Nocardia transvalensis]MBF6333261.1 hypothetical protein [Nocardia transvalensis]
MVEQIGNLVKKFIAALYRTGIGRFVLAIAGLIVGVNVIVWVGNPYLDDARNADWNASSVRLPPKASTTPDAPLPPGFPSMALPPPMPEVPPGHLQSVPTKFGLSYSVPNGNGWRPSNQRLVGWSDRDERIVAYGSVSDYGYGTCPRSEESWIGLVGVRGRNGVDVETAAREEVSKAERIFADGAGRTPKVEISTPRHQEVDGRPAVRYTATVSAIPHTESCSYERARLDVVATVAYTSAEVMILVVEHHEGFEHSLTEADVDTIIASLRRTE